MKNVIILLSFLSLFLFCGETAARQPLQKECTEYSLLYQGEESIFCEKEFTAMPNRFNSDMAFSEIQTIARQLSVRSERMLRLNLLQSKCASKDLMRKVSLCKDGLTQQISQRYTSFRRLSWNVVSEYYVFGLRHILI